jgi:hypothetical protein
VSHSDNSRKGSKSYPRRGPGYVWYHRKENKRARKKARASLTADREPAPDRPRHAALWDWF